MARIFLPKLWDLNLHVFVFQEKIFPTIHIYWEKYQTRALEEVKNASDDGIVVAGDGRHDSMGHSAKYCAYSIFCCNVPMIIHFTIVQVITAVLGT